MWDIPGYAKGMINKENMTVEQVQEKVNLVLDLKDLAYRKERRREVWKSEVV